MSKHLSEVEKSPLLASLVRKLVEDPRGTQTELEYSVPIEWVYDEGLSPDVGRLPDDTNP